MDRATYLSRIGIDECELRPDDATLRLLQRRHLFTVPFENLDIHWNRPIVLDIAKLYHKIVEEKRGGFCYELNGLFNELLRDIGYRGRLISARVFDGSQYTEEFDHAAIIATIGEEEFVTDVGFGAFTTEPLRFLPDIEQQDPAGTFVIRRGDEDGNFVVAKKEGNGWRDEYMFQSRGRDLTEFEPRCEWQQTSSDSVFRKNKVCSLLTDDGRKTLSDRKYIVTKNGEKSETPVTSDEDFLRLLKQEFGLTP
jgi:N-hydroxyarylamine O-acetyltransferase